MDAHTEKHSLFPKISPYGDGMLALGDGHEMYWEQSGNPDGYPVLFLHGGPGAGANAVHRRFFDPDFYRIVIFDQRGAGRSKPFAETNGNTTQNLIGDIEALREHLGIDKWLVFGGSWGSTLALVYGISHPERCAGFVLRGIFLGTGKEMDWFLNGIKTVYPEAWKALVGFLPEDEQDDVFEGYYRRLMDPDPNVHRPAAGAWNRYETSCSTLMTDFAYDNSSAGGGGALALARIEAHYFKNKMFLDEGYLLKNIARISDLPMVVVQGRYDMVCPIITADKLVEQWPGAEYVIVPDAGHSAMETGVRQALVRATQRFKDRLGE